MKKKKPDEPPPENGDESLQRLAEFTKRILQVPKHELQDSDDSTGPKKIDEPCPE
jgi:hypothetical protein